jgi:hypothetical protein
MSAADMEPGPARVRAYADEVLALILEDVAEGVVPPSAADFSELHSHVDANEYLIGVGQVYDPALQDSLDEINAVEDLVTERIRAGALVAEQLTAADTVAEWQLRLYGSIDRKRELLATLAAGLPVIEEVSFRELRLTAATA